jgi:hypothetical protein
MSITAAGPPPPDPGGLPGEKPRVHAVWLDWPDYLEWASGKLRTTVTPWGETARLPPAWAPGMHWALIGPTGEGKSTHAVGILGLRKWVLALDPKGEDDTLQASGWQRITHLSSSHRWVRCRTCREIDKRIEESHAAHLLVGGQARTDEQDLALQKLMRDGITYSRHSGGWTLYVDEFELLSSQRMFRLGPNIERMLITARRDKTSVVTSFQAAAWVSKHATRQASFCTLWPTRDRDMIKNVAQSMGRDWQSVAGAVDLLPPFHTLTIPKQIRAPMVITSAPKVTGNAGASAGPSHGQTQRGQQPPPARHRG